MDIEKQPKLLLLTSMILVALLILESGCASILHGGYRDIVIRSNPPGANFLIVKRGTGETITSGTTPMTVSLNPKKGYFRGQTYQLRFEFPDYESVEVTLKPTLSGWYFGNIIFGGLIGMLIVDPLTGSMWNLSPDEIDQNLHSTNAAVLKNGEGFIVAQLSEISEAERQKLVRIY